MRLCMAIGIDLGFVALELSQLAKVLEKVRKQVGKFTRPAIVGTLIGSACMNALRSPRKQSTRT